MISLKNIYYSIIYLTSSIFLDFMTKKLMLIYYVNLKTTYF